MTCTSEIIGIKSLTLVKNIGVRLVCPNISVENEVDLIANGSNSYIFSEGISLLKWERTLDYSKNYKQNFFDEFTFQISGIENEIPEVIKEIRNNRLGYIAIITTTGGLKYVFQSPIFPNKENTKQISSHTWTISLSYNTPSQLDKLTLLNEQYVDNPVNISNNIEIIGIKSIALYINDNVSISRPDPSKENEVDIIVHGQGSYVISDINEYPKWERVLINSENFTQKFIDVFSFNLHGIENQIPQSLQDIRNNRLGYIVEIITTGGKSFVFPTPVFLDSENTKLVNSHSWNVSLSYRVATFNDKLLKLNTLLMNNSYIIVGDNEILGYGDGAIVSN